MRRTERIDHSGTTVVAVGNQSADADNRMVDVLGELVAHGSADVVVGPADKVIGGSVATQVGNRFNVLNDDVGRIDRRSRRTG
jgi:hypothetical protein